MKFWQCLNLGGTGHWPVPAGNLPAGSGGKLPSVTGGSPVPPTNEDTAEILPLSRLK